MSHPFHTRKFRALLHLEYGKRIPKAEDVERMFTSSDPSPDKRFVKLLRRDYIARHHDTLYSVRGMYDILQQILSLEQYGMIPEGKRNYSSLHTKKDYMDLVAAYKPVHKENYSIIVMYHDEHLTVCSPLTRVAAEQLADGAWWGIEHSHAPWFDSFERYKDVVSTNSIQNMA